jgi:hypothetical protein
MIVVKFQGGLGNQIFQLHMLLVLEEIRGQRVYWDTSWFKTGNRYFELGDIIENKRIIMPLVIRILSNVRYSRILKFFNLYHEKIHDPIYDVLKIKILPKNVHLDGYWAYKDYFKSKSIINKMHQILNFSKSTLEKGDLFWLSRNRSNSIAVHVRRGDYKNKSELFNLLEESYYLKSINFLIEKYNLKKEIEVYVFSDNINWVKENFNFQQTTKYITEMGEYSTIDEFYLLSSFRYQVIANSTFSWWSVVLNLNDRSDVCVPEIWYTNEKLQNRYERGDLLNISVQNKVTQYRF